MEKKDIKSLTLEELKAEMAAATAAFMLWIVLSMIIPPHSFVFHTHTLPPSMQYGGLCPVQHRGQLRVLRSGQLVRREKDVQLLRHSAWAEDATRKEIEQESFITGVVRIEWFPGSENQLIWIKSLYSQCKKAVIRYRHGRKRAGVVP